MSAPARERASIASTPNPQQELERHTRVGSVATVGAIIAFVALAALVIFGGGPSYTVKARFINAGQLVDGNLVQVGGTKAGTVKGFEMSPDGQVDVELEIDEKYAPLRQGTRAIIRQSSQSSVAGRYVELLLPPVDESGGEIDDGGRIDIDHTSTAVDLDEFFNTLDPPTRRSLAAFYEGSYRQWIARGREANRGLQYLNPSLSASSRLFHELSKDPPVLERFLVDSSRFVTALAERKEDLAALVGNLNRTTRALGSEKVALAELVSLLPDFMRQANTTYVNLRATLDDVDPLVEASKPVARKLRPYLAELRPFANEARPTVRDLSRIVRRPGRDNDLVELNRTYPRLAEIALDTRERTVDAGGRPVNVGERRGAFPEATQAFRESAPIIAHGRPYTVDLFGWFDDFSHTGAYDALGSFSRVQTYFNAFTLSPTIPTPIPLAERAESFRTLSNIEQYKRCPGASEEPAPDRSNVWSEEEQRELDCRESDRATGPRR